LDLVEIAPQANPPVAKIVEFQKFKYEEGKKEQAAKKNAKEVELKEIWLTPRIAEHDLRISIEREPKTEGRSITAIIGKAKGSGIHSTDSTNSLQAGSGQDKNEESKKDQTQDEKSVVQTG
jgi:hypothetical protein